MRILFIILSIMFTLPATAQLGVELDHALQRNTNSGEPGIALRIEKEGKEIYNRGFGTADLESNAPITATTNFRMASVSKQFTAMAILLLEKDQKLSFNDPIRKFFPELPASVGAKVKIKHLLNHSTGLIDYESLMDANLKEQLLDHDILTILKEQDTSYFEPGTSFRYSNSAYCLLTLIVERASGKPYSGFVQERIFKPLGMDHSSIYQASQNIKNRAMGYARDRSGKIIPSDQSLTSATKGDGGVYTSLEDYTKWVQAIRENKLVDFTKATADLNLRIEEVQGSAYHAGWFKTGDALFHSGSTCGFSTFVIQIPGQKFSLAYFSNLANNEKPFVEILNILATEGVIDLREVMPLHALTR